MTWNFTSKQAAVGLKQAAVGLGAVAVLGGAIYLGSGQSDNRIPLLRYAREDAYVVGGVNFIFGKHVVTKVYTGRNASVGMYGALTRHRDEIESRVDEAINDGRDVQDIYRELEENSPLIWEIKKYGKKIQSSGYQ